MAEGSKTSSYVAPTFEVKRDKEGRCDWDNLLRSVKYAIAISNAGGSFLDQDDIPAHVPVRMLRPGPTNAELQAMANVAAAKGLIGNLAINADARREAELHAEHQRAFQYLETIRKEAEYEWQRVGLRETENYYLYQKLAADLHKILNPLEKELYLGNSVIGLGEDGLKLHELVTQIEAQARA
jgi:hypothetical protein